jgi:hypothetical protein
MYFIIIHWEGFDDLKKFYWHFNLENKLTINLLRFEFATFTINVNFYLTINSYIK